MKKAEGMPMGVVSKLLLEAVLKVVVPNISVALEINSQKLPTRVFAVYASSKTLFVASTSVCHCVVIQSSPGKF